MKKITRTIYGDALQAAKNLGIPHVIVPKTTLNEKFKTQAGVLPAEDEIPAVRYYTIGNGGSRLTMGPNGRALPDPIDHDPRHGALYNHLPFVLRPIANDLTMEQRKNYCLRTIEQLPEGTFVAYWAKRIDLTDVAVGMELTVAGVTKPFVPDTGVLNPTPPALNNTGVNATSDAYVEVSAPLELVFNEFDVNELVNACKILYNDEREAIVNEIGFGAAVDRQVNITTSGGLPAQMLEAIGFQLVSIVSADHNVAQNNQGFIKDIELGSAEPLPVGVNVNAVTP